MMWLTIELLQYLVVRFTDSDFLRNHQCLKINRARGERRSSGRFSAVARRVKMGKVRLFSNEINLDKMDLGCQEDKRRAYGASLALIDIGRPGCWRRQPEKFRLSAPLYGESGKEARFLAVAASRLLHAWRRPARARARRPRALFKSRWTSLRRTREA